MSHKDLFSYLALGDMFQAAYGGFMNNGEQSERDKTPPLKLTGFTHVQGRKRISKKKRKQLKSK